MLVSIIIPVYNAAKFLPRCIESLLSQSYRDLEILLIIDDGSTDDSRIICDHYAVMDARVRVYHQNNIGVSFARNHGMDLAQGAYLMFVDADDFVDEGIVETLIGAIKTENVGLAVCTYKTYLFYGDRISMTGFIGMPARKISVDEHLNVRTLDFNDSLSAREKMHVTAAIWGRLYVSETIKKNSLRFNTNLDRYEDVQFNASYLSCIKDLYISNKDLYNYCVYQNGRISLTDRVVKNKFHMIIASYDAICRCYGDRPITYIKYFYGYIIIGHIIRLFQANSPYSFWEALSEVRTVCMSKTYDEVMAYYRLSKGASKLIPLLLRMKLFFLASVVAKLRMLKASLSNKPIRQWCFSTNSK